MDDYFAKNNRDELDINAVSSCDIRALSGEEIDQISGGVVPLGVAAYWSAGFFGGVYGGWTFGNAYFSS